MPTPSLLLTLLTTDKVKEGPITDHPTLPIPAGAQSNINEVFKAIDPPQPNLIKDVAQKELYETLYSIIEKEYDESKKDPKKDKDNSTLNSAIGMALEMAIKEASKREAAKKPLPGDASIIALRDALRKKVIEALTPKQPPVIAKPKKVSSRRKN